MKNILIVTLILIGFYSCDKIEGPYKEINKVIEGDTVKKIVLLDFTGQRCLNCPQAHRKIKDLQILYGHSVIPIAIHCGDFSYPLGGSQFDMTTPTGFALGGDYDGNPGHFPIASFPIGLVNSFSADSLTDYGTWAEKIQYRINSKPDFLMKIMPTYFPEDSTYSLNIKANVIKTGINELKIVAYLVEDSITAPQQDGPNRVDNYLHRHVLRDGISQSLGDVFHSNLYSANDSIQKTYSSKKIPLKCKPNQCYIVAFIYDNITKEILQAEEVKIIEE